MTSAPAAPGRIGEPIEPTVMRTYLDALHGWLGERRTELDQLDAAILDAGRPSATGGTVDRAQLTGDMMLSLALWKAVQDRYELLLATWDSGRVGVPERQRLASLLWGRLDATLDPSLLARAQQQGAGLDSLALSLPEACRLSDALASQLRSKLQLDPDTDAVLGRIKALRAQLERIRDQVALEPAGLRADPQQAASGLSSRLDAIVAKQSRGGDVGGLIGPLEIDAAHTERDLIVSSATRRQNAGNVARARELRQDLEDREAGLAALVQRCVQTVTPAPKYAVPDVDALGPIPNTPGALEEYLTRLDRVSQAMQVVQHAYSAALGEHEALGAKLAALAPTDETGAQIADLARRVHETRPSPLAVVRQLLSALDTWTGARASSTIRPHGKGSR